MAWKNYKKEVHRRRIAKRYLNSWDTGIFESDRLHWELDDNRNLVENPEKHYGNRKFLGYWFTVFDVHTAMNSLTKENFWKLQEIIQEKNFNRAKQLTNGSYDKYRRVWQLRVGKAWFGVHRKYDKHVKYIGKYGTEEEIDELVSQGDILTHFGWWW